MPDHPEFNPGYPMGFVKLEPGNEMVPMPSGIPYGQVTPLQFQQMQQLQNFNAMQMQMRMQLQYPFEPEPMAKPFQPAMAFRGHPGQAITPEPAPVASPGPTVKRARRADHAVLGDDGDAELKQLAYAALEVPFPDFAAQVRAAESDMAGTMPGKKSEVSEASSERSRQVFGMVWLLKACEAAPPAVVPRSRIYARYANICAEHVVKPLSPASFGKLVRILFPNLTTRRLGMRGQSKYHYCGIKLIGEETTPNSPAGFSESPFAPNTPSNHGSPGSFTSAVSTPLPSSSRFKLSLPAENDACYALQHVPDLHVRIDRANNASDLDMPLVLPPLHPYLPPGTDYDAADTLASLYKSHCTALFEALRYMQVKKLFYYLSSFNSTLTAPVQKLYTCDALLAWVERADLVTYRAIVKMLTKLSLQNVPTAVLQQLKSVGDTFPRRLEESLAHMPKTVVAAKGRAARAFANLLARLVKVIETGQACLRVLASSSDRQAMLADWNGLNFNELILRELPCSIENGSKVLNVLTRDVPHLLEDASALAPYSGYLSDLAAKFADTNPRLYLLISSNLLTVCLREISMAGGPSFGSWWLVRCWVDEYMNWELELGGFLAPEFDAAPAEKPVESQSHVPSDRGRSGHFVDLLETNFEEPVLAESHRFADSERLMGSFEYQNEMKENLLDDGP